MSLLYLTWCHAALGMIECNGDAARGVAQDFANSDI